MDDYNNNNNNNKSIINSGGVWDIYWWMWRFEHYYGNDPSGYNKGSSEQKKALEQLDLFKIQWSKRCRAFNFGFYYYFFSQGTFPFGLNNAPENIWVD